MGRPYYICPCWAMIAFTVCGLLYIFLYEMVQDSWSQNYLFRTLKKSLNDFALPNFVSKVTETNVFKTEVDLHENDTLPLITLFTTWKDESKKYLMHNITVGNWLSLAPYVVPVLFTNDTNLRKSVLRDGWHVEPIRHSAADDAPVLKYMFSDAMKRYNSTFYGYSNGDILFTESLIATLWAILSSHIPMDTPVFLTGRRTNIQNLTPNEAESFVTLKFAAKTKGKLFHENSEDYFFTNRVYPWDDIPAVVIGRPAYDNWLVLNARKQNHYVIDTTNTVLAIHQTSDKGNYEGHSKKGKNYNSNLLGKMFKRINYMGGSTTCGKYFSKGDEKKGISIQQRNSIPKFCLPLK